jgi:alanine dehydrogenase
VLLLTRRDVEDLLDPDELLEAVGSALSALSAGDASMPARTGVAADAGGYLGVMPAFVPGVGALTTKLVSVFPSNAAAGLPTHQAVVAAFDPSTGAVAAVMDGTAITAARTAAASALATRLLARSDASVLAIVGTGVQASSHLHAVTRVRPFREVRIAGRDRRKAEALAAGSSTYLTAPDAGTGPHEAPAPVSVSVAASFADAVAGADVVCACTHAAEPVVERAWLSPGVHVTSVGLHPDGHEVDRTILTDALVAVESRSSALAPYPAGANDLARALRDGTLTGDRIVELGELVAGTRAGRSTDAQTTFYRSVGVAVEDAAAAALVLDRARERGVGRLLEL